jgi:hypothetical protein
MPFFSATKHSLLFSIPVCIVSHVVAAYVRLCAEDAPMVRQTAFGALPRVLRATSAAQREEIVLPLLHQAAVDTACAVRPAAVAGVVAAARVCGAAFVTSTVLPLVDALADDASWRVRRHLCRHLVSDFSFLLEWLL